MIDLFAYIDPSTGSIFIQAVIGSALAIGVIFRNFFGTMIAKLRGKNKTSNSKKDTQDEED